MGIPVDWLLKGPPYVQYRTRVDLLGQREEVQEVREARAAMLAQPEISELAVSLSDWPGKALSSHRSASQSFHTLNFLADLGCKADDDNLREVSQKILSEASPEGPFRLNINISSAHGGSGQDTGAWALCDAPNLVYALVRLGFREDARVKKAVEYLTGLVKEFGWPCAASPELGNFRGPGRKDEPCPYANLVMLKLLALYPEKCDVPAVNIGVQTITGLWKQRQSRHPFIFYMGTDFCKLKAPLIWYDILHVLDVLSSFPQAVQTEEFGEMLDIVKRKATVEGTFIPESVYVPYKTWDFGQKKLPSRWLTFLVYRIMLRSEKS
jgi:hypothetical protein